MSLHTLSALISDIFDQRFSVEARKLKAKLINTQSADPYTDKAHSPSKMFRPSTREEREAKDIGHVDNRVSFRQHRDVTREGAKLSTGNVESSDLYLGRILWIEYT